eukprot:CAMPEP_0182501642 /NCGR_PEP_ID=MMETSP1321-20130603/11820_1 /TAXON_ID=91990 /ORGANISM="Bolidomonas sp., Strain RCC1657" /LENGTH=58 /DNA_ID=CAMNT_0024706355 /DNA_START=24 /DNA_END=197 /DNA_ORIENTATION=+
MGAGASIDTSIDSTQELAIFKELRAKYELSLSEPDVDQGKLFDTLMADYEAAVAKIKD